MPCHLKNEQKRNYFQAKVLFFVNKALVHNKSFIIFLFAVVQLQSKAFGMS
jgi:hypothetical protein